MYAIKPKRAAVQSHKCSMLLEILSMLLRCCLVTIMTYFRAQVAQHEGACDWPVFHVGCRE